MLSWYTISDEELEQLHDAAATAGHMHTMHMAANALCGDADSRLECAILVRDAEWAAIQFLAWVASLALS